MHFTYGFDTKATPEQVFDAFTDFSERRLDVWRQTLDPAKYELRERGDNWALVKEGSAGTKIWVLVRYDWDDSHRVVRWTLVDSTYCDGGGGDVTITPREPRGSHVAVDFHHSDSRGVRGGSVMLMQRLVGPVFFPRWWRTALDRVADGAAPAS